jgi:hypothetical protein
LFSTLILSELNLYCSSYSNLLNGIFEKQLLQDIFPFSYFNETGKLKDLILLHFLEFLLPIKYKKLIYFG